MEMIHAVGGNRIASLLLDFDGTISTLRCGWEEVMQPDTNHLHAKKKRPPALAEGLSLYSSIRYPTPS